MNIIKYLGKEVYVLVDRPKGSKHPNYPELIYEVNYGFLPGTVSADGEEIDCYLLDIEFPTNQAKGVCIGVLMRKNGDHKLIIITNSSRKPDIKTIRGKIHFQEKYSYPVIYITDDFSQYIFDSYGVKQEVGKYNENR